MKIYIISAMTVFSVGLVQVSIEALLVSFLFAAMAARDIRALNNIYKSYKRKP